MWVRPTCSLVANVLIAYVLITCRCCQQHAQCLVHARDVLRPQCKVTAAAGCSRALLCQGCCSEPLSRCCALPECTFYGATAVNPATSGADQGVLMNNVSLHCQSFAALADQLTVGAKETQAGAFPMQRLLE